MIFENGFVLQYLMHSVCEYNEQCFDLRVNVFKFNLHIIQIDCVATG